MRKLRMWELIIEIQKMTSELQRHEGGERTLIRNDKKKKVLALSMKPKHIFGMYDKKGIK
jgi:hypothetical protein